MDVSNEMNVSDAEPELLDHKALMKLHWGVSFNDDSDSDSSGNVSSNNPSENEEPWQTMGPINFENYRPEPYSYDQIIPRVTVVNSGSSSTNIDGRNGDNLDSLKKKIHEELLKIITDKRCSLCNVNFQSLEVYNSHCNSGNHVKKYDNWVENFLGQRVENALKVKLKDLMQQEYCHLCNAELYNFNLRQHYESKKHKRRENSWYETEKAKFFSKKPEAENGTYKDLENPSSSQIKNVKSFSDQLQPSNSLSSDAAAHYQSVNHLNAMERCNIIFHISEYAEKMEGKENTFNQNKDEENLGVYLSTGKEEIKQVDGYTVPGPGPGTLVNSIPPAHSQQYPYTSFAAALKNLAQQNVPAGGVATAEPQAEPQPSHRSSRDTDVNLNLSQFEEMLAALTQPDYCHVCKTELKYPSINKEHYESKRHDHHMYNWYKTEINLELSRHFEKESQKNLFKLLTTLECKVCGMFWTSEKIGLTHYISVKHRKNVQQWYGDKEIKRDTKQEGKVDNRKSAVVSETVPIRQVPEKSSVKPSVQECYLCQQEFYTDELLNYHVWSFPHQELFKLVTTLIKSEIPVEEYWIRLFKNLVTVQKCVLCQIVFSGNQSRNHSYNDDHLRKVNYWIKQYKSMSNQNAPEVIDRNTCYCPTCEKELDGTTRSVEHYNSYYHNEYLKTYCQTCKVQTRTSTSYENHLKSSLHIERYPSTELSINGEKNVNSINTTNVEKKKTIRRTQEENDMNSKNIEKTEKGIRITGKTIRKPRASSESYQTFQAIQNNTFEITNKAKDEQACKKNIGQRQKSTSESKIDKKFESKNHKQDKQVNVLDPLNQQTGNNKETAENKEKKSEHVGESQKSVTQDFFENYLHAEQDAAMMTFNLKVSTLDDDLAKELRKLANTVYYSKKIPPEVALHNLQKFNQKLDKLKEHFTKNEPANSVGKNEKPNLDNDKVNVNIENKKNNLEQVESRIKSKTAAENELLLNEIDPKTKASKVNDVVNDAKQLQTSFIPKNEKGVLGDPKKKVNDDAQVENNLKNEHDKTITKKSCEEPDTTTSEIISCNTQNNKCNKEVLCKTDSKKTVVDCPQNDDDSKKENKEEDITKKSFKKPDPSTSESNCNTQNSKCNQEMVCKTDSKKTVKDCPQNEVASKKEYKKEAITKKSSEGSDATLSERNCKMENENMLSEKNHTKNVTDCAHIVDDGCEKKVMAKTSSEESNPIMTDTICQKEVNNYKRDPSWEKDPKKKVDNCAKIEDDSKNDCEKKVTIKKTSKDCDTGVKQTRIKNASQSNEPSKVNNESKDPCSSKIVQKQNTEVNNADIKANENKSINDANNIKDDIEILNLKDGTNFSMESNAEGGVLEELNKLVDSVSDGVLEKSVILTCLKDFNKKLDNYLKWNK